MALIVFGLNHNSAPLEVLEKTVIPESRLSDALSGFNAAAGADEAVILSTCNRCEIYGVWGGNADEAAVADWLCSYCGVPKTELNGHCFTYRDHAAIRHLMRVAGSVDSMIVGEPQILGQVKSAYRTALDAKFSGAVLSRLFERAISTAKQVRSETALGEHPVSYVSAAITACRRLFENLSDKRVLLLGTGEMIEQAAGRFKHHGVAALGVAGRSGGKVRAFAADFDAKPLKLGEIGATLHTWDVVVSCTASTTPILDASTVVAALKRRRHKPMCMIDMALPRDIDAAVEQLPDVYLYTLASLADVVDGNKQLRLTAAAQAEAIIRHKAGEYAEWMNSRRAADLIASLLDAADGVRADALNKTLKTLRGGKPPEQALAHLSTTLTGKLAHPVLAALKRAAERGQFELLDAAAHQLKRQSKRQAERRLDANADADAAAGTDEPQ